MDRLTVSGLTDPITPSPHQVVDLHGGLSSESLARLELDTGEALEALHCCLDPSILSIFEDTPSGEVRPQGQRSNHALFPI